VNVQQKLFSDFCHRACAISVNKDRAVLFWSVKLEIVGEIVCQLENVAHAQWAK
jgi:hypothetical protein